MNRPRYGLSHMLRARTGVNKNCVGAHIAGDALFSNYFGNPSPELHYFLQGGSWYLLNLFIPVAYRLEELQHVRDSFFGHTVCLFLFFDLHRAFSKH